MIDEAGHKSSKSNGKVIMSGIIDAVSSSSIGLPLGNLMESGAGEINEKKEISNIITSYPLPENIQELEDIAKVLINYMQPFLFRDEKRTKDDAEHESMLIKLQPELNAAFNKLNKSALPPKNNYKTENS